MIIDYLSASRGNTYIKCPFKYFLSYHLQLPELSKDTIYTTKGSAVHSSLEAYAKREDYLLALKKFYAKLKLWELDDRKKGFLHPVAKSCQTCKWAIDSGGGETICSIAERNVKDFAGCPKPNFEEDLALTEKTINAKDSPLKRKILGAEVPFKLEFEGFRVRGYIDLATEIDEETMEIRDYKTGRNKNADEVFKDLQIRIYSMVAKVLYPQYKYVIMTLDYLKTGPMTVIFSKGDDEKTRLFLKELYQKIESSKDPLRIKSYECNWCVGWDTCGNIRQQFVKNGKFVLPPPVIEEEKTTENG